MRQLGDNHFADLLKHVCVGKASFKDCHLLWEWLLSVISRNSPQLLAGFTTSPVIVGTKMICDAINLMKVCWTL